MKKGQTKKGFLNYDVQVSYTRYKYLIISLI